MHDAKVVFSNVALIVALACPLHSIAQPTPNEACSHLRGMMDDINRQAPVKLDFMTELIGGSVFFTAGKCHVVFQKAVNEKLFIESILDKEKKVHGIDLNKEIIIGWLNSKEGRLRVEQLFLANVTTDTMKIARLPFMNFVEKISFDKRNVQPIEIHIK